MQSICVTAHDSAKLYPTHPFGFLLGVFHQKYVKFYFSEKTEPHSLDKQTRGFKLFCFKS